VTVGDLLSTFVCVAEDPCGQVVGFASGGPERGGRPLYTGELYATYTLQDHQRRGLGRRLKVALVRRLIQAGMASLLVWVLADNAARRFMRRWVANMSMISRSQSSMSSS
jgi:GNAT superfamily N-acetyltransferase